MKKIILIIFVVSLSCSKSESADEQLIEDCSGNYTTDGVLIDIDENIYNDDESDAAVAVLDFGGDKTSSSGDFTIQFPTADASNAIIRIA